MDLWILFRERQLEIVSAFLRRVGYLRYLTQPALWPELRRRFQNRWQRPGDDHLSCIQGKERAVEWCKNQSIDSNSAYRKITGSTESLNSLRELYPEFFSQAEQSVSRCPVKMGGAGNLDLLYALCESTNANAVLETGVAYGWSSLAILLSMKNRLDSRLYSVDLPYLELHNDPWVGIVVPESLRNQWVLFRMADREGVPKAIERAKTFDVAHYDSDKSYEGRLYSYRLIWNALRSKGILISDDVGDNLAFHDFCQEIKMEPVIVTYLKKYQGILVKP